jgi:hypothetical protein
MRHPKLMDSGVGPGRSVGGGQYSAPSGQVKFNPGDYAKSRSQYALSLYDRRGEIDLVVSAGTNGVQGYINIVYVQEILTAFYNRSTTLGFDNSITHAQLGADGPQSPQSGWLGFGALALMFNYLQWKWPGARFGTYFDTYRSWHGTSPGGINSNTIPDWILNHSSWTFPSTSNGSGVPQFGSSFTTNGSIAAQPGGQYGYILNVYRPQTASPDTYSPTYSYVPGDQTTYNGYVWSCLVGGAGHTPPTTAGSSNTYWTAWFGAAQGWALYDPTVASALILFYQALSYWVIPDYPVSNYNAGTTYYAGQCVLYNGNAFMYNAGSAIDANGGNPGSGHTPPAGAGTGNQYWDPYSIPANCRNVTIDNCPLWELIGSEDEVALDNLNSYNYTAGGTYNATTWDTQYTRWCAGMGAAFPKTICVCDYSFGVKGSTTATMYAFVRGLVKSSLGVGNVALSQSDMYGAAWIAPSGDNVKASTTQFCAIGYNGTEGSLAVPVLPIANGTDSRGIICLVANVESGDANKYLPATPPGLVGNTPAAFKAIAGAATFLSGPTTPSGTTNGGLKVSHRLWDLNDNQGAFNTLAWSTEILPGIQQAQADGSGNYAINSTRPSNIA